MPRLPVPGSDDGQWGEILNAFLRVVHNDDGSFKTPPVPLSQKGAPDGVAELDSSGKVPTGQLPDAALVGDATPSQKGIIQLAGDLDNTASVPRVANSAITNAKVSDTAAIDQSKIANLTADLSSKLNTSGGTITGDIAFTSSAANAIRLYNTADATTNTEYGQISFGSNLLQINTTNTGTGTTARDIRIGGAATYLTIGVVGVVIRRDTTAITSLLNVTSTSLLASAGTQSGVLINPTINQSGSAGYNALYINPTESTTGSGTKYLINAQVGSSQRLILESAANATNNMLITAPNSTGDVALGIQNNATGTNETATLNFYTTTNLANPFGRIRTTRVDGGNSRLSLAPITASAVTNHIQMYGDTGFMSLGAGSAPANGLVTIGSNSTAATGGLWFGTDTNLYRSAANTLKTDDAFESASSIRAVNRYYLTNSGSNFPGMERYADTDSGFAYDYFYRKRTTGSTTQANDVLGAFGFRGHDGTNYINGDGARIQAAAAETFTASAYSAHIDIVNNNVGTATAVTTWRFAAGGVLQSRVTGTAGGLTFGSGATQDVNLYRSTADVLRTDDRMVIGTGLVPRVVTLIVSGSTYTPNCDTADVVIIASPTANFTVANPTGSAQDGQEVTLRIRSGVTGYAPSWGTQYQASGMTTLPTTALPASKTIVLKMQYDAVPAKWILIAADTVGY